MAAPFAASSPPRIVPAPDPGCQPPAKPAQLEAQHSRAVTEFDEFEVKVGQGALGMKLAPCATASGANSNKGRVEVLGLAHSLQLAAVVDALAPRGAVARATVRGGSKRGLTSRVVAGDLLSSVQVRFACTMAACFASRFAPLHYIPNLAHD